MCYLITNFEKLSAYVALFNGDWKFFFNDLVKFCNCTKNSLSVLKIKKNPLTVTKNESFGFIKRNFHRDLNQLFMKRFFLNLDFEEAQKRRKLFLYLFE